MTTIKPSKYAIFEKSDGTTEKFEQGCQIDGSHDSPMGFAWSLFSHTRNVAFLVGRDIDAGTIEEPMPSDDDDTDGVACVNECMLLLNDCAPEGWFFEIEDNSLFFRRDFSTTVAFDIERKEKGAFLHYDGERFSPDFMYMWTIEVASLDEDGDAYVPHGAFAATWAGGQACYVNIYGDVCDAEDIASNVQGSCVMNACEVLHIGDPEEERSEQMAHDCLVAWCQEYADGTSWEHDAGHYGFPY